ncbi:MAG: type II toxin-antitoxin system RelE/ParE family toxin [Opitutaceae bacterium]|nr:type II toxin-antitoxin system RelE/ParE family toxin [Cytophagales bacterium]
MAEKSIVWTETARKQRREILKYWTVRNNSVEYARKLIEIIKIRTRNISKYPESGIETDYNGTRTSAIGHFSLYYKIDRSQIIIVAFWDNRQDPETLLEIIKRDL